MTAPGQGDAWCQTHCVGRTDHAVGCHASHGSVWNATSGTWTWATASVVTAIGRMGCTHTPTCPHGDDPYACRCSERPARAHGKGSVEATLCCFMGGTAGVYAHGHNYPGDRRGAQGAHYRLAIKLRAAGYGTVAR